MKTITLLGSTGSIGQNTLDVVARFPDRYRVYALTAHSSVEEMARQIERFGPQLAVMYSQEAAQRLEALNPGCRVEWGLEAMERAASAPQVDLVVSAMVGAVGLRPTYAAIQAGKRVALANKETLVLAGELMMAKAKETGAEILPVDSEHNAIFQSLAGDGRPYLERIWLTASGGPFRDLPLEQFGQITLAQALNHPNWKMGPKITIDSATMMNKGLEVIEARWLFGVEPGQIKVVIHRQSIIHSLVEYADSSVIAQLGLPDMRTPIVYCLAWPQRLPMETPRLNLAQVGRLDFTEVDAARYPCLGLAMRALELGGGAPAALNGANEEVVAAYLRDRFPFLSIADILGKVMNRLEEALAHGQAPAWLKKLSTIDEAQLADGWGRQQAAQIIQGL